VHHIYGHDDMMYHTSKQGVVVDDPVLLSISCFVVVIVHHSLVTAFVVASDSNPNTGYNRILPTIKKPTHYKDFYGLI
jgi:hypothetical protein